MAAVVAGTFLLLVLSWNAEPKIKLAGEVPTTQKSATKKCQTTKEIVMDGRRTVDSHLLSFICPKGAVTASSIGHIVGKTNNTLCFPV